MAGLPSRDFLSKLERKRESIRNACESMLMEARAEGREQLNEGEDQRYAPGPRRPDAPSTSRLPNTAQILTAAGCRRTCRG